MLKKFNLNKEKLYIGFFSFIFSLFFSIGSFLENNTFLSNMDKLFLFINFIFIFFGLYYLISYIKNKFSTKDIELKNINYSKKDYLYFIRCSLIIFALWLPVFLAYYPGLLNYDSGNQLLQYKLYYSNHHPILHTLYLILFYYKIGGNIFHSYNIGVALACLFQMLIFSSMISFSLLFIKRLNISKKIRIILLLFIGLFPVFSILSISLTKDVFFSGFFLLFITCISYFELDKKSIDRNDILIPFIISIFGSIMFRSNGIYAIVVCFIFILIFLRNKKIIITFIFTLCITLCVNNILINKLDIKV